MSQLSMVVLPSLLRCVRTEFPVKLTYELSSLWILHFLPFVVYFPLDTIISKLWSSGGTVAGSFSICPELKKTQSNSGVPAEGVELKPRCKGIISS